MVANTYLRRKNKSRGFWNKVGLEVSPIFGYEVSNTLEEEGFYVYRYARGREPAKCH